MGIKPSIQKIPSILLFIKEVSVFYNRSTWDIRHYVNICNLFPFYLPQGRSKGFMIYVKLAKN